MPRGRLLIIIAFVIILGVVGVFVFLQLGGQPGGGDIGVTGGNSGGGSDPVVQQTGPTPTPFEYVDVIIAVQELRRGVRIPAEAVQFAPWPLEAAPFNAVTNIEDVVGKIARTDIFVEQPILTSMVTDDYTSLADVGSIAAAVLPDDLVAVAIPIDRVTSVAYAVQDGDRVDIIVSMLFVTVDDTFQTIAPNNITLFQISDEGIAFTNTIQGRPDSTSLGPAIIGPSERQRPRLVTQQTIQNALVLHVGTFPLDGDFLPITPTPSGDDAPTPTPVPQQAAGGQQGTAVPTSPPPRPDIITLGVTPQEAVVLTWAVEARLPLTLALRSANYTGQSATQSVTLDYLIDNYNVDPPGRRDYTIEPALRSIRQLLAGDEISLSNTE